MITNSAATDSAPTNRNWRRARVGLGAAGIVAAFLAARQHLPILRTPPHLRTTWWPCPPPTRQPRSRPQSFSRRRRPHLPVNPTLSPFAACRAG